MDRRKVLRIAIPVALGILVIGIIAYPFLAPRAPVTLSEVSAGGDIVRMATWRDGEIAHHASGQVAILARDGGHFLRFTNYSATAGPDVHFWMTPGEDPRTTDEVEGRGMRVHVPQGHDGQANVRGDFEVPLPQDFDPTKYAAIVAWCDTYNVLFGTASWGPLV